MTQTIDAARALDLLRQAVAQDGYGPDYVYESRNDDPRGECVYVRGGYPSCVVGHALAIAGFPLSSLEQYDTADDSSARYLDEHFSVVTTEAAAVLEAAQRLQDKGKPWGEALKAAEAVAR